jgi:hypothetical protein
MASGACFLRERCPPLAADGGFLIMNTFVDVRSTAVAARLLVHAISCGCWNVLRSWLRRPKPQAPSRVGSQRFHITSYLRYWDTRVPLQHIQFVRLRCFHFGNHHAVFAPRRRCRAATPTASQGHCVWFQHLVVALLHFPSPAASRPVTSLLFGPCCVAAAVPEDEMLRQRAVSTTQRIDAYRLDAMMGHGGNGAVARMTFTRACECATLRLGPISVSACDSDCPVLCQRWPTLFSR